jgi:enamine deaminase RidA (YjgF/YER057c/UK114 family)
MTQDPVISTKVSTDTLVRLLLSHVSGEIGLWQEPVRIVRREDRRITKMKTLTVRGEGRRLGGAEDRLRDLGIQLPAAPTPLGTYLEAVQTGRLLFLSGMLPVVDHKPKYVGRLGKELDAEGGRDAVYTAALNALAAAKQHLGTLDRVTHIVRLAVFISTSGDFFDQPRVADAASDLFRDIFGDGLTGVRSVVGVASLPLGLPVELEVILEVTE